MSGVLDSVLESAVRDDVTSSAALAALEAEGRGRARAMLETLAPVQRDLVLDPGPEIAACVPRRGGKSFAVALAALITGEAQPGSVTIIITLTLKSAKKIYWTNPKSSIKALARKYGFKLGNRDGEFYTNDQDLSWRHPNGSVGYLLGAENREALEYIRGLEADLYVIDECKSFAPSVLDELIDEILSPQRGSRMGRIIMIGTPGNVLAGPFYRATNPGVVVTDKASPLFGLPFAVPHGALDPGITDGRRLRGDAWSFHTWTLEQNSKMPHQWREALALKRKRGWGDDHPTWLREYCARWLPNEEGLVYRYLKGATAPGRLTWVPDRTRENPTGLPREMGPWRLVFGMDLGYHDATALVVMAYSQTRGVYRHVWDYKKSFREDGQGLDVIEAMDLVQTAVNRFGKPDMMFVDSAGGASRMLLESLRKRYGFPIDGASKTEKNDYIELVNADFAAGLIQIIPGTDLEAQLCSVEWDTTNGSVEELARAGKLRVNKAIPDDVTDAFLYAYRGAYHHFAVPEAAPGPAPGTPEFEAERERRALARARREVMADLRRDSDRLLRSRGPTTADLPRGATPPGPPLRPWRFASA